MATESSTYAFPNLPPGCPEDWESVPLARVAEVRFSSVDKLTRSSEFPVRLCNYVDVYNNDYITRNLDFMQASATRPEIDRYGLQAGDVIITKDSETPNDIGIPAVVDYEAPDLLCGYHLALIRARSGAVDPIFLAKQLAHHRVASYFGRQANGLTRYGLPLATVEKTPLWLPCYPEQKVIGALLRRVDQAIAESNELVAKLRSIIAGLLHDLLTHGLDENGQLRNPERHPEQFQNSSMGRIPKSWRPGSLGALTPADKPIVYGILMPGRGFSDGVPVIKVKDIRDGEIDTSDLLLTDPRIDEAYRRSRVVPGDLLFTIRGTVGRMAIVPPHLERANITQDTARITLHDSNRTFVARWLGTDLPSRFVNVHTIGVAVKGINLRDVRRIPVPVVPRAEQDRIAAVIQHAEGRLNNQREVLRMLNAIKLGLNADLVTGRVRVPDAVLFAEANV